MRLILQGVDPGEKGSLREIILSNALEKEDDIEFRKYSLLIKVFRELSSPSDNNSQKEIDKINKEFSDLQSLFYNKATGKKGDKIKDETKFAKAFKKVKGKEVNMNIGKRYKANSKKGKVSLPLKDFFEKVNKETTE